MKCNKADIIAKRDRDFDSYAKLHIEKGKISLKDDFIIGDKVLVYREVLGDKLASNWSSGFEIELIISPGTYIVKKALKRLRAKQNSFEERYFSLKRGVSHTYLRI